MLDNLLALVREESSTAVINNPAVPNEQNDAVISSATHSVAEGMQGVLAQGGLGNLLSLFGGSNDQGSLLNNPVVSNIISNFTGKLTSQHGIDQSQAGNIASSLIPNVINSLVQKTNDPNNSSFDLNSLIGSLTGGNAGNSGFDFGSLVSKFTGGSMDANHDGHIGLDDIISKVTSGAQQQQSKTEGGGGGLMDMIQGFLK